MAAGSSWSSGARTRAASTSSTRRRPDVGRHPDSDIFLDDITVSRRHAEIVRKEDEDGFKLNDVGSLNGTYVNKERVEEAELRSGDEIQIGKFKLIFLTGT